MKFRIVKQTYADDTFTYFVEWNRGGWFSSWIRVNNNHVGRGACRFGSQREAQEYIDTYTILKTEVVG